MSPKPNAMELHLSTVEQLFNSLDPSPFHERDLDDEAERYLVGWAREIRGTEPLRLVVTLLKSAPADGRAQLIPDAIHSYFCYRANQTRQDLRELLRTGWLSLIIGLFVLTSCLLTIHYAGLATTVSPMGRLIEQSLLLLGWVSNWRPLEIFLYDWWPVWRHQSLLRRLAEMPVEVKIVATSVDSEELKEPQID